MATISPPRPRTGPLTGLLDRLAWPHRFGELAASLDPLSEGPRPDGSLTGVVTSVVPTAVEAATLTIRPGTGWRRHLPGQHVTVGVDVDGVRHHRTFTITSLPGRADGQFEITVQAHPDGLVSRHLVQRAVPGELLRVSRPSGRFTLPVQPGPLLFLTGGSGVTPAMVMLRRLAADPLADPDRHRDEHLDVVVVHHARSRRSVLFHRELTALTAAMPWLRLELVITRDDHEVAVPGTHLDGASLERLCPDWAERETYACGPTGMLEAAGELWGAAGVSDRLHLESFHPLSPADPSRAAEGIGAGRVSFARAGLVADPAAGTPLLEVAEEAGLRPPSGCRMGICHTCSTLVTGGAARDLRDGRRIGPGEHAQLCVCTADGDIALEL